MRKKPSGMILLLCLCSASALAMGGNAHNPSNIKMGETTFEACGEESYSYIKKDGIYADASLSTSEQHAACKYGKKAVLALRKKANKTL